MAGGGTGGHVIPGAGGGARTAQPRARSFFVGTERGMEAKLVPAAGFRVEDDRHRRAESGGLRAEARDARARLPSATLRLPAEYVDAAAVFSMGGYVAGPPVMAALLRAHAGGRDGAERRPGLHQSRDRPLRRARADLVPGDRALLSARAAPK